MHIYAVNVSEEQKEKELPKVFLIWVMYSIKFCGIHQRETTIYAVFFFVGSIVQPVRAYLTIST